MGAADSALDALRKCRTGGDELVRLHQEWFTLDTITRNLNEDFTSLENQEEEVRLLNQTETP